MGEVFETTDLEAAEHVLRNAYGTSMRIAPRGQRRGIWLVHTPLGALVRFQHTRYMMSFDFTGTPLGVLVIGHLRDGRLTYRSDGSERPLLPGDVYLAVQPDHPFTATSDDVDAESASIDPALLSQVAGHRARTDPAAGPAHRVCARLTPGRLDMAGVSGHAVCTWFGSVWCACSGRFGW
jgi:hypothetical protein